MNVVLLRFAALAGAMLATAAVNAQECPANFNPLPEMGNNICVGLVLHDGTGAYVDEQGTLCSSQVSGSIPVQVPTINASNAIAALMDGTWQSLAGCVSEIDDRGKNKRGVEMDFMGGHKQAAGSDRGSARFGRALQCTTCGGSVWNGVKYITDGLKYVADNTTAITIPDGDIRWILDQVANAG